MQSTQLPVYIVDDEASIRESLSFVLEGFGLQVSTFASGIEFLEQVDTSIPACMVLDSRMPDMRGQEVQQLLNEQHSCISIIYLTGHGDVNMAVDALKTGAIDFFQKPVDPEKLAVAIFKGQEFAAKKHQHVLYFKRFKELTPREQDTFNLVAKGLKNQEIADVLCVSLRTIEVHRAKIMKKLQVATIAELVLKFGAFIESKG